MSEELKAAQARIACLEGEIAKRDEELAACRVAVENCEVFRARIAELESRIVWLECEAQGDAWAPSVKDYDHSIHSNPDAKEWADFFVATFPGLADKHDLMIGWFANAMMAMHDHLARKAQGVVIPPSPYMPGSQPTDFTDYELGEIHGRIAMWEEVKRLNAAPVQQVSVPDERGAFEREAVERYGYTWASIYSRRQGLGYSDSSLCMAWIMWQARAMLAAAPAAPAADAGLVDMYRHLQKVTPYRFKKIQDASITDGGDVMYFHKDRFDAALLADMAAHCAAPATADSDVLECGE